MATKEKIETVYCTKYAITQGIFRVLGYETELGRFVHTDNGFFQSLGKSDWARDGNKALERADEMRVKKIKSVEKQRDKLLQMEFELPPELEVVDA